PLAPGAVPPSCTALAGLKPVAVKFTTALVWPLGILVGLTVALGAGQVVAGSVRVKVALAVSLFGENVACTTHVGLHDWPVATGGTVKVKVFVPFAPIVTCPSERPPNVMLGVSPAPQPLRMTVMAVPLGPLLGEMVS